MLTSDNKENPGDLAAHLIPTISGEALEETRVAINAVRRSIDEYGGEVVFKFSQAKGAFYKQIAMHSATQPGACKALCDHWMACHANALSLFDGLYVGGQKGQFNIDILVSIKQLQIDQTIINSLNSQITIANEWLASYGLKSNSNYPDFKEVGGDAVDVLLGCTADKGCYKLMFLQWDHGKQGHVVSTYTAEGGEVRFFDPNYGDFKFPTLLTFREWLTLELWPRAYDDESMSIGTLSYTVTSTKH
ncbi:YopT-type cysteine protease domain-containing protein [Pseudomonas putida]|nr:YopT-type cysteine protease domain-containing protein [Pseudomonas putida]